MPRKTSLEKHIDYILDEFDESLSEEGTIDELMEEALGESQIDAYNAFISDGVDESKDVELKDYTQNLIKLFRNFLESFKPEKNEEE